MNASNQIVDQILEANPDWKAMKKRYSGHSKYFKWVDQYSRSHPDLTLSFKYSVTASTLERVEVNGSLAYEIEMPPGLRKKAVSSGVYFDYKSEYAFLVESFRASVMRICSHFYKSAYHHYDTFNFYDFAAYETLVNPPIDRIDTTETEVQRINSDFTQSWERIYKPSFLNINFKNLEFITDVNSDVAITISGKIKVSDYTEFADYERSQRANGKSVTFRDYLKR